MNPIDLIKAEPTEEILTEERLKEYIENKIELRHYIGYEISGYVHLGSFLSMSKVADLQKAGVKVKIFLADYHSWINKKLGGDLSIIKRVAGGYFKEALKQTLKIAGGDPDKVEFVLGSELYEKVGLEYLENIIKISMDTTLARVRKSITIMGRKEKEIVDFAQLLYPIMQVADIFALDVNIPHGGMDQRKAHVIAIEVGKNGFGYQPIALHHHLLVGMHITEDIRQKILTAKREGNRELFEEGVIDIKMSKSKPNSAIFIHDKSEEIKEKINKAFCPIKEIELNPILELARYIIFRVSNNIEIVNEKTKESKVYNSYASLESDYQKGLIHPLDLKTAVYNKINDMLEPARKYFLEGPGKRYLEDMESIKVSR